MIESRLLKVFGLKRDRGVGFAVSWAAAESRLVGKVVPICSNLILCGEKERGRARDAESVPSSDKFSPDTKSMSSEGELYHTYTA